MRKQTVSSCRHPIHAGSWRLKGVEAGHHEGWEGGETGEEEDSHLNSSRKGFHTCVAKKSKWADIQVTMTDLRRKNLLHAAKKGFWFIRSDKR